MHRRTQPTVHGPCIPAPEHRLKIGAYRNLGFVEGVQWPDPAEMCQKVGADVEHAHVMQPGNTVQDLEQLPPTSEGRFISSRLPPPKLDENISKMHTCTGQQSCTHGARQTVFPLQVHTTSKHG
jgi:hypothetical protein